MKFDGFVDGSYSLRNIQADCQQVINWFVEVIESGHGKGGSQSQLVPRDGLKSVVDTGMTAGRGGFLAADGTGYCVFDNTLFSITGNATTEGWSVTALTTGLTNDGKPCMFNEGIFGEIYILAGNIPYVWNGTTSTLTTMTIDGYSFQASSQTYFDTYMIYSKLGTNQFVWTQPASSVIENLNFATAEANADIIVGLIANNDDLWIFGTKTIEVWQNYGQPNETFIRRQGILIETGCASPKTICKIDNTLAWLGQDDRGGPVLNVANGYTPVRMSLHSIEQRWLDSTPTEISNATAYTYQEGGHQFYCLDIEGQDTTWVFDLTATKQIGKPMWHERRSTDGAGVEGRYVGQGHVFFNGWHVQTGYSDGQLYVCDPNTYSDNGNPFYRDRTAPHINNEMKNVFYDRFQVDFFTGATSDLNLDPQIMMQFSDDGGMTWSDEWFMSGGMTGAYMQLIEFRKLGSSRSRVFRLRCTDGQYWAVSGASVDMRAGTH